jgi:hypothetical protein
MDDQLIITIDYTTAPRADDLGELFAALARDYKDTTMGRVLVVYSIQQGSIRAILTDWPLQATPYIKDAVEIAKGAKALADFGKLLTGLIHGANSPETKALSPPRRRKKPGQRSVEAILKIAAENGRAVRVKHTSPKGETLEVEMNAETAIRIREEMLSDAPAPREVLIPERLSQSSGAELNVRKVLEQLYSPTAADLSVSDAQVVIDVFVDVLQGAGLGYVLPQIVMDLSNKGAVHSGVRIGGKTQSVPRQQRTAADQHLTTGSDAASAVWLRECHPAAS